MGYSYARQNGRHILACDACGHAGGVRKRRCPYGWCQPPALCAPCYTIHKSKIHGEPCREGAEHYQAEQDRKQAILDGGGAVSCVGYGSWHETVPDGMVGRGFRYGDGSVAYVLMSKDIDQTRGDALSDYPEATAWVDHPDRATKEVGIC